MVGGFDGSAYTGGPMVVPPESEESKLRKVGWKEVVRGAGGFSIGIAALFVVFAKPVSLAAAGTAVLVASGAALTATMFALYGSYAITQNRSADRYARELAKKSAASGTAPAQINTLAKPGNTNKLSSGDLGKKFNGVSPRARLAAALKKLLHHSPSTIPGP